MKVLQTMGSNLKNRFQMAGAVAVVVVLLVMTLFFGSWYTIDQGERGVPLRNGAVVGSAEPGLGFQLPPGDVIALYSEYGSVEGLTSRLVDRQVPTQVENVFGQYTAISAVQNRVTFVKDVTKAIRDAVKGPLVIDGVQIENIDFSDAYEKSIELRMQAEVLVQTEKQNLEKEKVQAQIAVTQANGAADSSLARARADAEATRIKGEAEATAIKARAQALAQNQDLVELTKAERWNGVLPTTMIPNTAIPFLNANK